MNTSEPPHLAKSVAKCTGLNDPAVLSISTNGMTAHDQQPSLRDMIEEIPPSGSVSNFERSTGAVSWLRCKRNNFSILESLKVIELEATDTRNCLKVKVKIRANTLFSEVVELSSLVTPISCTMDSMKTCAATQTTVRIRICFCYE